MDFQKLIEKYPEQEKRFTKLEKSAKVNSLILDLKEHGGLKLLIEELKLIIDSINEVLLTREEMTKETRDVLMAERRCYSWLFDKMNVAGLRLKQINEIIKRYE